MRILTVCSSAYVFGAEIVTLKMLEGFKLCSHEQIAVTSVWTDGEMSRRLQQLGIREEIMPFGMVSASITPRHLYWTASALLRLPILWWQWWRLQRSFRPDVVVLSSSRQGLLLLPWLGQISSFLVEHTSVLPTTSVRRLYKELSTRLTGFIAVSEFMGRHLQKAGVPLDKIFVVRNGVVFERDRQLFDGKPVDSLRVDKQRARIGMVAQLSPAKGHDCLVEAIGLLRKRGNDLIVRTFGTGDPVYTSRLQEKVRNAGLEDIWEWKGYEPDKARMFGSIDICVVPSCFGDPFPTVALEAGIYGLPVVASAVGGLPEIIEDGVTGYLVEPNSPEQLAEKIQLLIDDPQKAMAMGKAGRERVFKNFTINKMVAGFEALFKKYSN